MEITMAKYKIESTNFEFPIILETDSNDEAYEMFTAYCDYQGVDEDEIDCEYDNGEVVRASTQKIEYEGIAVEESIVRFTFERMN